MARRIADKILWQKIVALSWDTVSAAAAFILALELTRPAVLDLSALRTHPGIAAYIVLFVIMSGMAAYLYALHRIIWKFTSFFDFVNILWAATLVILVFLPVVFFHIDGETVRPLELIFAWMLMIAFWMTPRIIARSRLDRTTPGPLPLTGRHFGNNQPPVSVIVAGRAAKVDQFLRELLQSDDAKYTAVAALTYEPKWHGRSLHNVNVLGGRSDLGPALTFLAQLGISPHRLVLADEDADESLVSMFLDATARYGLALDRVPTSLDIAVSSKPTGRPTRPVAISDLLDRPRIDLDKDRIRRLVSGKRVLVTGAGGSIGSELVRQISNLEPRRVVLLDDSEFNLYSIDKELSELHPEIPRSAALCNVRARETVNRWFGKEMPEIVFHTAALKHVPLLETHPLEGVHTNVIGTQNVADACVQFGVPAMVLISTDKAVNPRSVLGATKRAAETYCQAIDAQSSATRILSVRFGNVLGSAGSVVPLFQRQLATGGPLTVTDPEVTRYFMPAPDAAARVLQASVLGLLENPQPGSIYALKMGRPVKIADLARKLIRLAGKRPEIDVKIEFIGLRAGEKLHEELVHGEETRSATSIDGIVRLSPRTSDIAILRHQIGELARAIETADEARALRLLHAIVPEFDSMQPSGQTIEL